MKIEHLAIWVNDLELMKNFYCHFFNGKENLLYTNPNKKFSSYFISFPEGPRLELMHTPGLRKHMGSFTGYAHLAFALGSTTEVDRKTGELTAAGFNLLDGPRTTGDGYYESVIEDPEGNKIEITE
jgi:lactoylglutathione lyase